VLVPVVGAGAVGAVLWKRNARASG
jgi:hypothetical protein